MLKAESEIRMEICQNRSDKILKNFDFLDMASKGAFRGPVQGFSNFLELY